MPKAFIYRKSQFFYSRTLLLLALIFGLLFINIHNASAHAYSASFSTINLTKSGTILSFSLDELSMLEMTGGDPNHNGMMDQEEFEEKRPQIEALLKENLLLKINNELQSWNKIIDLKLERKGEATVVKLVAEYPSVFSSQSISFTDQLYLNDSKANYADLVTIYYGKQNSTAALSANGRTWSMLMTESEFEGLPQDFVATPTDEDVKTDQPKVESKPEKEPNTNTSSCLSFLKLGMHHILSGYDHLLFLLGLLIVRQSFKQLTWTITAFTVAHSITLTLTVLGLIDVPSTFVEAVIALSICYVAAENIFRKTVSHRWVVTFLFGLIHGMGFADILLKMNIPKSALAVDLASFNIGIEIIQLLIVVIFLPLLIVLHRWKQARYAVIVVSGIAFVLGGVWLLERLVS